MTARINIGFIRAGSAANGSGVFNGQNLQSGWDSHSRSIGSLGIIYGNLDTSLCGLSVFNTDYLIGQPLWDDNIKMNAAPRLSEW